MKINSNSFNMSAESASAPENESPQEFCLYWLNLASTSTWTPTQQTQIQNIINTVSAPANKQATPTQLCNQIFPLIINNTTPSGLLATSCVPNKPNLLGYIAYGSLQNNYQAASFPQAMMVALQSNLTWDPGLTAPLIKVASMLNQLPTPLDTLPPTLANVILMNPDYFPNYTPSRAPFHIVETLAEPDLQQQILDVPGNTYLELGFTQEDLFLIRERCTEYPHPSTWPTQFPTPPWSSPWDPMNGLFGNIVN